MKVIASPAPTRIRAPITSIGVSTRANATWPAAITSAPEAIMIRDPNRSTQHPDRDLHAGVREQLHHREQRQHRRR